MKPRKNLRQLLREEGPIIAPGCLDALSAKIVEHMGFSAVYLGGWATGAKLGVTEPLLTLVEQVHEAAYITEQCGIPLIVDGDAGFGDATHARRLVRESIKAGIAAIHIEDQQIPKRLGYHVGVKYVIPIEEMMVKLETAIKARGESDLLIIARTDAREAQNGSLEEAVARCQRFVDAGADVIMPFSCPARSLEEASYVGHAIKAPLLYVNDETTSNLTVDQLMVAGFKILIYPLTPCLATAQGLMSAYGHLKKHGVTYPDEQQKELIRIRKILEDNMNITELYAIESKDRKPLG
jgi:methylisocitrate lyase